MKKIEKLRLELYKAQSIDGKNLYRAEDIRMQELAQKVNEIIDYLTPSEDKQ